jgi:hypothetical protein
MLFGSNFAHDDRVDTFQMARVSEDFDSHWSAIWHGSGVRCSKMVFDVSRILLPVMLSVWERSYTLHFCEDSLEWLTDDVCQNIESTSVRHS